MRLRNINPLGEVDLPLIGRTLEAGEVFEIDDERGNALLEQAGNYELVREPKPPTAKAKARAEAERLAAAEAERLAADGDTTDPTDDEPSGAVEDDTAKGEAQ
jgi:hypothetical protein